MWIWNADGNLTDVEIWRNESLQNQRFGIWIEGTGTHSCQQEIRYWLWRWLIPIGGWSNSSLCAHNKPKKSNLLRKWSNSAIGRLYLPKLLSFMFFEGNIRATHCELFQQWTCIDTDAKARGKQNERHKFSSSMVRSISLITSTCNPSIKRFPVVYRMVKKPPPLKYTKPVGFP